MNMKEAHRLWSQTDLYGISILYGKIDRGGAVISREMERVERTRQSERRRIRRRLVNYFLVIRRQ